MTTSEPYLGLFSLPATFSGLGIAIHPFSYSLRAGSWKELGKFPAVFGIELDLPSLLRLLISRLRYPFFPQGWYPHAQLNPLTLHGNLADNDTGGFSWLHCDSEITGGNLYSWKRFPGLFSKLPTPTLSASIQIRATGEKSRSFTNSLYHFFLPLFHFSGKGGFRSCAKSHQNLLFFWSLFSLKQEKNLFNCLVVGSNHF